MGHHVIKNIIVHVGMILFIVGCVNPGAESRQTQTGPIADLATSTLSLEHRPTETGMPTLLPTSTAESTATPASTATEVATIAPANVGNLAGVENQCLEISDTLPAAAQSPEGVLALFLDPPETTNSFLLNLRTGHKVVFPSQGKGDPIDIAVSPNGEYMAYLIINDYYVIVSLIVTNALGEIQKSWNLEPKTVGIIHYWLNNQQLLMGYGQGIAPKAYTKIFNPFSGERKLIQSDYPHIYNVIPIPVWGEFGVVRAIYDPSLTRVIYPSEDGIEYNSGTRTFPLGSVVLMDLQTKQVINSFYESLSEFGDDPRWSPDGNQFVIDLNTKYLDPSASEGGRDIYLISKDGKAQRLSSVRSSDFQVFVGYSWSPDGRFIAFWLKTGEDEWHHNQYQLAVIDVQTHKLVNYCIPGYNASYDYPQNRPVWSPDSRYVAVTASVSPDPYDLRKRTVLVDTFDGWAYKLVDGATAVGWMK
jgi:hypothetical protein